MLKKLNLAYSRLLNGDIPQASVLLIIPKIIFQEQLESESMKLKQLEDKNNQKERKLISIISNQEDKIRTLKSKLKELSEAQKGTEIPTYKREVR